MRSSLRREAREWRLGARGCKAGASAAAPSALMKSRRSVIGCVSPLELVTLHRFHGIRRRAGGEGDRKSTRLNSSHGYISYAVFCLKKKKTDPPTQHHTRRLQTLLGS